VLRGEAGGTVRLPDGRDVPRLPGATRWMWDGEFCGAINLRHMPGSQDLPPHVSGHVGYAVVPWKRGRGYAIRALGLVLPLAASLGLRWLDATCAPANHASRRVLIANGAVEIGCAPARTTLGEETLLFRIPVPPV
jgi:predicted acetyltransferase